MNWQAATFLATQHAHRYVPFISAQMYYSLLGRDIEYEIVPFLQHAGLGLLVWSPLAGGFLSGKYTRDNPNGNGGRLATSDFLPIPTDRETGYSVVEKLREMAAQREATPAQVALAWLLAKLYVTSIILGVRNLQQFSENVKAAHLELSQQEIETLDALTMPKPLYPYGLIARGGDQAIQQALQG